MELTKLEDLSASIVTDFEHMKKREEEMRDTNGKYTIFISCNLQGRLSLLDKTFHFAHVFLCS